MNNSYTEIIFDLDKDKKVHVGLPGMDTFIITKEQANNFINGYWGRKNIINDEQRSFHGNILVDLLYKTLLVWKIDVNSIINDKEYDMEITNEDELEEYFNQLPSDNPYDFGDESEDEEKEMKEDMDILEKINKVLCEDEMEDKLPSKSNYDELEYTFNTDLAAKAIDSGKVAVAVRQEFKDVRDIADEEYESVWRIVVIDNLYDLEHENFESIGKDYNDADVAKSHAKEYALQNNGVYVGLFGEG